MTTIDGLIHLSNGSAADVLPVRHHVEVLLAAQEIGQLLVDVSAAVEARVDDDGVSSQLQSERLLEDRRACSHRSFDTDVEVTDFAAGQLIDFRSSAAHPAFV